MKIIRILTICFISSFSLLSQNTLEISECYKLAKENYPLIKQRGIIERTSNLNIQNLGKNYLPQLNLNAQATYQSDITKVEISIPNFPKLATPSLDQYKLSLSANQLIYDGGIIATQQEQSKANVEIENQKIDIELFKLNDRINQLYFGLLLINEQLKQIDINRKDIETGIKKVKPAIENGIALKTSVDVLEVQLLSLNQKEIELNSAKNQFFQVLSLLIGKEVSQNTKLQEPNIIQIDNQIKRPELKLLESQNKILDLQKDLISSKVQPKLNVFLESGYGKPGLNMFKDEFAFYYIAGVKFNWALSGLYTSNNEEEIVKANQEIIYNQKEVFIFNLNQISKQQSEEINKIDKLIEVDSEIIKLKNNIKNVSLSQLENGTLTTNDYLRDVNSLDLAYQNQILHRIQLLQAKFNLSYTLGNN